MSALVITSRCIPLTLMLFSSRLFRTDLRSNIGHVLYSCNSWLTRQLVNICVDIHSQQNRMLALLELPSCHPRAIFSSIQKSKTQRSCPKCISSNIVMASLATFPIPTSSKVEGDVFTINKSPSSIEDRGTVTDQPINPPSPEGQKCTFTRFFFTRATI